MSVHEDTLQGLREALEYVQGDKTKARSVTVITPEDEVGFYGVYRKLTDANKAKLMRYADELLQAN